MELLGVVSITKSFASLGLFQMLLLRRNLDIRFKSYLLQNVIGMYGTSPPPPRNFIYLIQIGLTSLDNLRVFVLGIEWTLKFMLSPF